MDQEFIPSPFFSLWPVDISDTLGESPPRDLASEGIQPDINTGTIGQNGDNVSF